MISKRAAKEDISLSSIPRLIRNRYKFRKEHPNYFYPDGLLCFVGAQGTGKTLSAVNYVYNLMKMYPCCKLVTNVMLRDYPIVTFDEYIEKNKEYYSELMKYGAKKANKVMYADYLENNRVFEFVNNDDFKRYNNGEKGVIFFVDEIQLYLNSLESKNVNIEVVTQISQQRKQRKHIVTTSQVFGRMAKPLREQFSDIVLCKNYFRVLQVNRYLNRDSIEDEVTSSTTIKGKVQKHFIWLHDPDYYKRYDTYRVIERGKFVSSDYKKGEIYDVSRLSSGS